MIPTNREWTHYDPQGPSFAGFCKPGSIDETNRLVLARVFDGGITFRRQIIRAAREPIFAPPIEVSLDKKRIVMTCHWLESIDMRYLYLFLCLLSVGCISVFFGGMSDAISSSIFIVVLIAACCVGVVRKFHFEKLKRLLVYGNAPHTVINAKLHPTDLLCVGTQAQNIVIYRDYIPFEFAGAEICNWSFVIDTGKKVDEYKNSGLSPWVRSLYR